MKKLLMGLALLGATYAHASAEVIPGEYIVKLKDQAFANKSSVLSQLIEADVVQKISDQSKAVLIRESVVKKAENVIAALQANPNVEFVEPNFVYRTNAIPNDPDMEKLWGMNNYGQVDPKGRQGLADVDVDADRAWDIQTGSRDVIVAVIDTGVDPTIEDLTNNMWVNEGEIPGDGIDNDENGFIDDVHGYDFVNNDGDPTDDHGHGSHCAGTIGGEGDNGVGVAGVAWKVRIMGLKFLSARGSGSTAGAISSIDYATQMGAHIMSNSWGGGGFSQALLESIQRANDANSLFIAAAGNSKSNNDSSPHYPSNYEVENVMAVAAINNSGELASFSSFGKNTVHISAPGRNIYSTIPGGYDAWSGTSMATPHVSGVAALLKSNEPEMTAVEMKERMMATARNFASLRSKTISGGLVNAYYALTNEQPPADPNDPSLWDSVATDVQTDHPYADNASIDFEITHEGASQIAVHFARFETENRYDKVLIFDAAGNQYGEMTGSADDSFSPVVPGDTIILRLVTDGSVNKHGFEVDAIHYKMDEAEELL
ncbi:MAG: S8 family serine peptidase [Bdellovibrionales bacterium]